jgi:alpha-L-fucosidase
LLDVGPEADGTIPPVQMERLKALGAWLKQNGEAIYDTEPWDRAVGHSTEGDDIRFTRNKAELYATILGSPKAHTVTLEDVPAHPLLEVYVLGDAKPLAWKADGDNLKITLPENLPGSYAYVIKLAHYMR